ncbi:MAG: DUF2249 domain-containing protein [Phycicoccus sp.]|nr:DUF2249 domain-containing protein [Phycicoccus sp.]NMM32852.1 DUF2249 domain-containing protein [Phycicoccus sp.]
MSMVVVATSAADAQAVDAVKDHHAQLAGALAVQVESLVDAASRGDLPGAAAAAEALVRWCQAELIPHALAEEQAMYPKAHEDPRARLLVDAMLAEHRDLVELVEAIRNATGPVRAAASAQALKTLFDSHLVKENDQILPLLAGSSEVSLADILGGMHELLGGTAQGGSVEAPKTETPESEAPKGGCGGACGCGGQAPDDVLPELDARAVPPAIRHATIFGALDSVGPGSGMVLVAPHDPLPLLEQVEQRSPGLFSIDYLERGPEAWRVRFVRA